MTQEEQWLLEEKYGGDTSAEGFPADRERLTSGEPLAYVIGWQPFLGLRIYLDSKPLIPRPETEWWVEQMLAAKQDERGTGNAISGTLRRSTDRAGGNFSAEKYSVPGNRIAGAERPLRVLDLCAGSGAIGCAALAALSDVHVSFGEIDPAHAVTIKKSISENNLDASRADIRTGDLFEPFAGETFDIIAVNPPYIPAGRKLEAGVTRHEPHQALFAGADGLDFIRRIAADIPPYLNKNGVAWIECDTEHAESARQIFTEHGLDAHIRTDLYGRPRLIVVSYS